MSETLILQIICALFWTPILTKCERWQQFKALRLYEGKLCSAQFIEREFRALNLLHCIESRPLTTEDIALIYNRKNKTCYKLRRGFQKDDWSLDLDGARLYVLGFPNVLGCIDGTFIKIIRPKHNEQDYVNRKGFHSLNVQAACKRLEKHAHLADLKEDETETVLNWMRESSSCEEGMIIWIGGEQKYDVGTNASWDYSERLQRMCGGILCSEFGGFRMIPCHIYRRALCQIDIYM